MDEVLLTYAYMKCAYVNVCVGCGGERVFVTPSIVKENMKTGVKFTNSSHFPNSSYGLCALRRTGPRIFVPIVN